MFKKAWTTKFPAAMEHFRRNVSFHSMSGLDYVWVWLCLCVITSKMSESLSISSFSLHFLFISLFSLHFLLIFSSSLHFLAARLPGCHNLCNPILYDTKFPDTQLVTPASIPRTSVELLQQQRTKKMIRAPGKFLQSYCQMLFWGSVIPKYNFSFCTNSSFSNIRWLLCRKMHKYNNSNNSNQINCLPF